MMWTASYRKPVPSARRSRNRLGPGPGIERGFKGPHRENREDHEQEAKNSADPRVEMGKGAHDAPAEEQA